MRDWLARGAVEFLLALLLVVTLLAVFWGDVLLERSIRLTPDVVARMDRATLSDNFNDGRSTAREIAPLQWECDIRSGFPFPYCGYEIYFGRPDRRHGIDLGNLKSVTLRIRYEGTANSVRMHLKNFDPAYARSVTDDTPKFNRVEHDIQPGVVQEIHLDRLDFGVADWWLAKHDIAPKMGHPQFDNIVSIDVQSGSNAPLGRHRFTIESIDIRRNALTPAQWYLGLLGLWVLAIGAYLIHRIVALRGEVEHRRAQAATARIEADAAAMAARLDPMTGLLNRRGLADALNGGSGNDRHGAVMMIDLDRFKLLNDTYGHPCGDQVLVRVAAIIRRAVRSSDLVGRWGGEEFVLICPGLGLDQARSIAEKLRAEIEAAHFDPCGTVTASIGVCVARLDQPIDTMVEAADRALYAAKHEGRNRVVLRRDVDDPVA